LDLLFVGWTGFEPVPPRAGHPMLILLYNFNQP
jgi:hypothetical protein